MITGSVAATAGRAVLRSRLLTPMAPRALFGVLLEAARGRTNPFTLLAVAAARWPDRAAMVDDDGAITYADMRSRSEALAETLRERGVGPGRAVGIGCRNGRGFVAAVFGSALLGADVVLLNTDFREGALAAALSAHRITTVVCDAEFADRVKAADKSSAVVDPVLVDAQPAGRRPRVAGSGRIVLLTSGTTGQPKGVPRKPEIASALGIGASILERTGLRIGARIAVAVPLFHGLGFGTLILAMTLGGTALVQRRFDAEAALMQASRHQADALTAVPVILGRILDLPDEVRARNPLPSLRVVISSGARLDPNLARRFTAAYGDVIYNGYGSSEVGIGALATPADLREAPETVGRPVAGCPVRILDENDRPVRPHVTGRVFVGGDLTFDAYTGGETKNVVANMTSTGDMGYFDDAGRLYIVGREDDMIVSGGENVYPRAVENALAEHPDVADNAVMGVPDEDYGERLVAFVVPRADAHLSTDALRDYLRNKVSRYEQPRDIAIVSEIPRNQTGKVLRNELQT
ncbi:MAG TPA: AMP-binding protein [Mycobacterium sp.]|nr:AMP-binding protein [Mycobacterium sp.]